MVHVSHQFDNTPTELFNKFYIPGEGDLEDQFDPTGYFLLMILEDELSNPIADK